MPLTLPPAGLLRPVPPGPRIRRHQRTEHTVHANFNLLVFISPCVHATLCTEVGIDAPARACPSTCASAGEAARRSIARL